MSETYAAVIGDTEIEHNHPDPQAMPGYVGNLWKEPGQCPACDALRQQANDEYTARRAKVRDPEPDPLTPALKGTVKVTFEVEQDVNILAFFQQLTPAGQKEYANLSDVYEEWERPAQYLTAYLEEDAGGGITLLPYREGVTLSESVSVDDPDVRINVTTGASQRWHSSWGPEHFEILRNNVPWLDAVHLAIEGVDDEEAAEDALRIPGPNDIPLEL